MPEGWWHYMKYLTPWVFVKFAFIGWKTKQPASKVWRMLQ